MKARGFTLVELLVAISILAIVAVLGWRALDSIIKARGVLVNQMEVTRGMQLAFAQMQSDADHLAPLALLHGRTGISADTSKLVIVRTVETENEPVRLQVITYRVRDGVLTRSESLATRDPRQLDEQWKTAMSGNGDGIPAVTLQRGLTGMIVQVYENGNWHVSTAAPVTPDHMKAGNTPIQSLLDQDRPTGLEVALQIDGQAMAMTKVFLLGGV